MKKWTIKIVGEKGQATMMLGAPWFDERKEAEAQLADFKKEKLGANLHLEVMLVNEKRFKG